MLLEVRKVHVAVLKEQLRQRHLPEFPQPSGDRKTGRRYQLKQFIVNLISGGNIHHFGLSVIVSVARNIIAITYGKEDTCPLSSKYSSKLHHRTWIMGCFLESYEHTFVLWKGEEDGYTLQTLL